MKHVKVIVGSRVPICWIAGVDREVANQNQRNILCVFFSIILQSHFIFVNRKHCFCNLLFFVCVCKFIKFKLSFYLFIYLFLALAQSLMVKNGKRSISVSWNLSQFLHSEWPSDIQRNFTSEWLPCLIVLDPVAMNTDRLGRPYVITSILNKVFISNNYILASQLS